MLTVKKSQQSSGRTPASQDFLSGMFFYGTTPTNADSSSWTEYSTSQTNFPISAVQIFSPDDCANVGIVPFADGTGHASKIKITTVGSTGDTLDVTFSVPVIGETQTAVQAIDLGTYTVLVTDTTKVLQAAGVVAAINNQTYITGFSAVTDGVDTVTITAPIKYGVFFNTGTPMVVTYNAGTTFASTLTQQSTAGVASQYAVWYYHISEFFRIFPTGNLWIGVISSPDQNFQEILNIQSASGNTLRLLGIWDSEESADVNGYIARLTQIQSVAMTIDDIFPLEVIYTCTIATDLSTMPNGQLYNFNKVTACISQDGLNNGNLLYRTTGIPIGNMGAKLATLASSRVSSDDAQPSTAFNVSDGSENATPAFMNGSLMSSIDANLITQLASRRYIFFATYTGNVIGTFWNDNWTFCNQTNRYAYMNDNRIASKITRICNKTYIPLTKGEVIYNSDGTISDYSIEIFQDAGIDAITAECITGFGSMPLISGAPIVTIDPSQPLQQTNNLNIVVQIGENGIARDITIYQGFTN